MHILWYKTSFNWKAHERICTVNKNLTSSDLSNIKCQLISMLIWTCTFFVCAKISNWNVYLDQYIYLEPILMRGMFIQYFGSSKGWGSTIDQKSITLQCQNYPNGRGKKWGKLQKS